MKKLIKTTLLTIALALLCHVASFAQTVVTGSAINVSSDSSNTIGASSSGAAVGKNNTVSSTLSYAFGEKISIDGYATGSFVFGSNDTITLSQSVCLGFHNEVSSMGGLALGRYLDAGGSSGTFVIGEGINAGHKLSSNHDHGLVIGFGSTKPTVFVTTSPNNIGQGILNKTGKVAIGNVTPQAKLHIRSDAGEDAGIILVPAQPSSSNTFIRLRDNYHSITVNNSGEMNIITGIDNPLGITSSNLNISENLINLGLTNNQRITLSSGNVPSIGSNACPTSGGYSRNAVGPSYVFEFGSSGLLLRTANYIEPRHDLITNWRDALSVKTDGTITLNGKVGVNTDNTTREYAFAVDGGIITTKVHIQDVTDWNDRVFGKDYPLMPLSEMEAFVSSYHHLPGILSETEVKTNGFDMAEMQSALLGKVEELVLYTIKQQKEIDSLREVVTVHFGYDACGNRISRTLEFQRMNEDRRFASLTDTFVGIDVAIFPNPTEGGFVLSLTNSESLKSAAATLCSLDGTILEKRTITNAIEEFDLSRRPAGIYLLHLSSDGAIQTWKIIKRN